MRRRLFLLSLLAALSLGAVAETVVEPTVRRRVPPEFTTELKRRWPANLSEGSVVIDFVVDARGNVAANHVGRASFREMIPPALTALGKWKFRPASVAGIAVPALMRAEIRFGVSGVPVDPRKETRPAFVALGDKLTTSAAAPVPGEFYATTEALPHLDKLQPHLPADLVVGDPTGKTLIEPCPILIPLPQIPREIMAKAGDWMKFRIATIVRPNGSPGSQYILSSTAPAANRAMAAAMSRWTFTPGTVNGQAATFLVVSDYEVGEIATMKLGQ